MNVIEIADEIERLLEHRYDEGYEAALDRAESEYDEQLAETAETNRLKGFEEGYDDAKEVFQKEGIEDVRKQAYDLGYADSQAKMDDKKELWRQAGFDAGQNVGRGEGYAKGWKDKEAEIILNQRRRSGGHGC